MQMVLLNTTNPFVEQTKMLACKGIFEQVDHVVSSAPQKRHPNRVSFFIFVGERFTTLYILIYIKKIA